MLQPSGALERTECDLVYRESFTVDFVLKHRRISVANEFSNENVEMFYVNSKVASSSYPCTEDLIDNKFLNVRSIVMSWESNIHKRTLLLDC